MGIQNGQFSGSIGTAIVSHIWSPTQPGVEKHRDYIVNLKVDQCKPRVHRITSTWLCGVCDHDETVGISMVLSKEGHDTQAHTHTHTRTPITQPTILLWWWWWWWGWWRRRLLLLLLLLVLVMAMWCWKASTFLTISPQLRAMGIGLQDLVFSSLAHTRTQCIHTRIYIYIYM